MNEERRYAKRARDATQATGRTITGYAAIFDIPTSLGEFDETIRPGAFTRAIRERQDCKLLVDHADSKIVARVGNGSLTLNEDSRGLKFTAKVAQTTIGDDLLENVRSGLLSQCSFGFNLATKGETWRESGTDKNGGKRWLRTVTDIAQLFDISVVTFPAYPQTSVGIGGDDDLSRNLRQLVAVAASSKSLPVELRSRIQRVISRPLDLSWQTKNLDTATVAGRIAYSQQLIDQIEKEGY